MALSILKYYILWKLSEGGNHTVNSLSRSLAYYRHIIYRSSTNPEIKTLKKLHIPKIDIAKALKQLEGVGLCTKFRQNLVLSRNQKVWTVKANIYVITQEGKKTYLKIMEKYEQIENLISNRRHSKPEKTPFTV